MSDTDTNDKPQSGIRWQLPPTPGDYGYKPPASPQDQPTPDEQNTIPYGFRRIAKDTAPPYNPYIPTGQNPALRDRPHNEWGNHDWVMRSIQDGVTDGMYVPQEQDIPPIFHNFTMESGKWAPPSIAMPAIAAGRFYGTGMQLYAKGMVQQANMARQNALASYEIAAARTNEYLKRFGNIYAEYGASEDGKDPGHPERLHEELYNLAQEYGDGNLKRLIERGDYDAVDKLAKHLDSNLSDVNKALAQTRLQVEKERLKQAQEKTRQEEAANKEYFGDTSPTATTKPEAKPAEPTAPPETPKTPGELEAVSSKKPDTSAAPSYSLSPAPTRAMEEAAQAEQMGDKGLKFPTKEIGDAVTRRKQALDSYMNNVANDPNLDSGAKLAAIKAANPRMGAKIDNLRSGRSELTTAESDAPANQIAETILGSMDPDWKRTAEAEKRQRKHLDDQAQISGIRQTLGMQEKLHANIAETVVKNANDMDRLIKLGDRLKEKGIETGVPITDAYMRELRTRWLGDPDVSAFIAQLALVRSDVGRILSAGPGGASGAVYPVSAQKEMREFFDTGISMPQLRSMAGVIKNDYATKMKPIADQINGLHGRIAQILGVPVREGELVNDDAIVKALTAEETKTLPNGKTYYKRDGKWHDE